jgi:HEAT repeat protein
MLMKNVVRLIILVLLLCIACHQVLAQEDQDHIGDRVSLFLQEFWTTKRGGWEAYSEVIRDIGNPLIKPLMNMLKAERTVPEAGRQVEWNQRRIAWVMGELNTNEAILALISILRDETLHVWARNEAARALGRTRSNQAVDPLIQVLSDKDVDPVIKRGAAYGLGFAKSEKAVPVLIRVMEESHTGVRIGIIYALGQIGTEKAMDGLVRALDDPDEYVRRTSYSHLRRMRPDKNIEFLIRAVQDDNWGVREDAFQELIKLGDVATDILITMIKDKNNSKRWEAVRILGKIQTDRAAFEIVPLLMEEDWMIRNEASVALVGSKSRAIIDPLLELLDGKDRNSCESAVWILGEMHCQEAVEPLLLLLHDDYGRAAAMALGKIGSKRAVVPIIQELDDPDVQVRRAAVWALAKLASEGSVEPLIRMLKNEDHEIRFWAAEGLKTIGTPEALMAVQNHGKQKGAIPFL